MWHEAYFQVKLYKTHRGRTTFGMWDVEKVHAVVARSTCSSQNVQNTAGSEQFWKLRGRKSAHCCGAKHISKPKMLKTDGLGALLEVQMSKRCTPLWREAHFEVKSVKKWRSQSTFGSSDVEKCTPLWHEARFEVKSVEKWRSRSTFGSSDVEKVHTVVARSTFRSQNVKNTRGSDHFWTFRCRFAWQAQGIVHLARSEQNVRVL